MGEGEERLEEGIHGKQQLSPKDILKTSYGDLLLRNFLKIHTYVCEKNLN